VFTDSGKDSYSLNSPGVAEAIRPFPEPGLANVSLMNDGRGTGAPILPAIAAVALATAGLVVWRIVLRRRRSGTDPAE
jgi:hypothetical protein